MPSIHIIKKHGGARKGSGRKPGLGGKRTRITRSVSLPISLWAQIDRERGKANRSQWIEARMGGMNYKDLARRAQDPE